MKAAEVYARELRIDAFLRRNPWVLATVTCIVAGSLYVAIYESMLLFDHGCHWSIVVSGLCAHAFFVITMHDGAHQSLSVTVADRWIMNTSAGLIVLPLYTELFRKYHLLHHAHTNTELDPLWASNKKQLFEEHRLLYAFLQALPFVLNLYMLATRTTREKQAYPFQPEVSVLFIVWSFLVAGCVVYVAQPSPWFVLGTFAFMTSIGAVRYWGEHMGVEEGKDSNTHWFPLGMGIGNHEAHHYYPELSWLSLTIGMWFRKKDTHPLKTIYRMFFDQRFKHYGTRR